MTPHRLLRLFLPPHHPFSILISFLHAFSSIISIRISYSLHISQALQSPLPYLRSFSAYLLTCLLVGVGYPSPVSVLILSSYPTLSSNHQCFPSWDLPTYLYQWVSRKAWHVWTLLDSEGLDSLWVGWWSALWFHDWGEFLGLFCWLVELSWVDSLRGSR